MSGGVRPGQVQNRGGELAAFLFVKLPDLEKNLRDNVLIETAFAWGGHRNVLPLEPARRVCHRAVFLGKSGTCQAIDGRVDGLHLLRTNSRRLPKLAGLIGIDLAHNEEIGLLKRTNVLLPAGSNGKRVHATRAPSLHSA